MRRALPVAWRASSRGVDRVRALGAARLLRFGPMAMTRMVCPLAR